MESMLDRLDESDAFSDDEVMALYEYLSVVHQLLFDRKFKYAPYELMRLDVMQKRMTVRNWMGQRGMEDML